jgi:autotransporter-associated beta strand protein
MRTTLAAICGIVACCNSIARADDFNVAALPGLQWWASAADSQLAQNPDGSGAVVNGSPVGFISDLSGNGRNAVMGNAIISGGDAFRPQFQANLVGFEPGILFNGSTTFSSLQSAFSNATSSGTIALAIEGSSFDDTERYIFGGGNAALGFGPLAQPDAVVLPSSTAVYGTNIGWFGGTPSRVTDILIARYQAGGELDLWADGVFAGSVPLSAIAPSSATALAVPLLGNLNYTTSPTSLVAPSSIAGGFYFLEGMETNTALTNAQVSQLYNYLSEKWPGVQGVAQSPNLYWNSTVNPQETPPTTINAGHIEGIGAGGNQRAIFYAGAIALYDANWNLLNSNQSPGTGGHCGDGDLVAGKIFAPIEEDFAGVGGAIAVYDATKPGLPLITSVNTTNPQHELSGLVVVPTAGKDGVIFVTSYFANAGGGQLWMYNYADGNVLSATFGAYLGNLPIPTTVSQIQGVAWKAPYFYFSGTTGSAGTIDRVLYQNGVLSNQSQVMWQGGGTMQGLTVSGSDILQVIQGGSTWEVVQTLSSAAFTQISPTGFNAWNLNGDGNFGNSLAWNSSTPNAAGAAVLFGDGAGMRVSADSVQVTVDGAYTAGSLSFDTTAGTSYAIVGDGQAGHGITLDSGTGSGASVNVYSGNHSIAANFTIADPGGLSFDIVSGSTLTITGSIREVGGPRSLTLDDVGTLVLGNTNTYTGGTTVRFGTLITTGNGSLGSGPLTVNASSGSVSSVEIGGVETVSGLSGTVQQTGTATVSVGPMASLTVNQNSPTIFPGTVVNLGTFIKSGSGTLELDGAPTLGDGSSLQVNGSGILKFNITTGAATVGTGVTATVASGATLQLSGVVSALSSGSNRVNIINNGSTASGGGLSVTGTNQSLGAVSSSGTTNADNATVYGGDTIVGDGTNAAELTATQILQNSLTINAGSTVTILPSGSGGPAVQTGASATASVVSSAASDDGSSDSGGSDSGRSDPFTAIQAAIASGSISSVEGQRMENRIAAIERLARTAPGLDVSLLQSRALASLPSTSILTATDSSSLGEIASGLLTVDGSMFGSGSSGAIDAFAPSADFDGGSRATVPEPSSALLAALAVIGLALATRRRMIGRA